MSAISTFRLKARWVQGGALAVISAVSLALLVPLWLEVTEKLDDMRTARRDSVIWTIVQLEVEYLELERVAMALDREGAEALRELHRRFNVFYSRVSTLRQSPIYNTAIAEAGEGANMELVHAGVERMLPLMDGSDAALVQQSKILIAQLTALHTPIRRIVANGNFVLTARTEEDRREAAQLVTRLGVASLVLFGSLFWLAMMFSRLYVIYKRRAKDNLLTSQRLATVITTSPDAIIVTDETGQIRDFNPAAETLLAYDRDQALGRPLAEMIADERGRPQALPFKLRNFFRRRMSGQTWDGRSIPLEVSQGATSLAQQRVFVYFLHDITDRLLSEEALRSSRDKALAGERAKAHFLAVMSHEMRTPLNGILGVVELMKNVPRSEKDRHYLSLLENSGQVLLEHVNEVLDITEIEARGIKLSIAPFHLDALIEEVVASLRPAAEAKGNALHVSISPDPLGQYEGDAMRLRQVVANLVSNAIKFTSDGQIDVTVNVQRGPAGAELEIQVTDTGIGIDQAQLATVFDDFVRLDRGRTSQVEGTGLGLGIVRRIVSAMDGKIGVESIKGEGSLFWVTLALAEPAVPDLRTPALPSLAAETDEAWTGAPLHILLVEDNLTNRFVLREMLELDGHIVTEAENGRIGADLAGERWFDVILMDVNMPVMGGVEATRLIRAGGASRATRIIALTAHVLDQDTQLYRDAGIDRVLSKPISRRNLARALRGQAVMQPSTQTRDVLNAQILEQLWSNLDREKGRKLLQDVLSEGAALMPRLKEPDISAALVDQVHIFAGSCAVVGAQRQHHALIQLEIALRGGAGQSAALIAQVQELWPQTRRALRDFLAQT
ncbi:ATP-binding protein [Thalassobius sp. S69A]|uniref:ATP-binding protein n=1 Tax=unclassified Thalassovita TaxID=2619711 RepID=UPI000C11693B|nr:hypothetical protein [Paracoccaceae bacterium]MBT26500.1 hypothetical protein [Paracoccaceae bacterium]